MFKKESLNSYFYKTKGFYLFFAPIRVPYKQIYELARDAGLKKTQDFGPIIEQGKIFGWGWIGVEVEKPAAERPDLVHIKGDFEVYEHRGPYKTLGSAYQKIRKERPSAKEYYNFYLDDPEKVKPEDCRTQIFFC